MSMSWLAFESTHGSALTSLSANDTSLTALDLRCEHLRGSLGGGRARRGTEGGLTGLRRRSAWWAGNSIRAEGATALAKNLAGNTVLTSLGLYGAW